MAIKKPIIFFSLKLGNFNLYLKKLSNEIAPERNLPVWGVRVEYEITRE